MKELLDNIVTALLLIFCSTSLIFFIIYLFKTLFEEFRRNRITTLLYMRSTSGITRGITDKGMIHLSHNLRFEEQLKYLYIKGYKTISLKDFLSFKDKKLKIPPKSLIILLDNGFRSNYLYAYPMLKKYRFSAAMFITPNPQSDIFTQLKGIDLPLTDRQIQEMNNDNILIGSHGMTSRIFSKLSHKDFSWELNESKNLLETIINDRVDCLATPSHTYLNVNRRSAANSLGYKIIIGHGIGTNSINSNSLSLRKIIIDRDMDIDNFKKLLSPFQICQKRILSDIKGFFYFIIDKIRSFRGKDSRDDWNNSKEP